MNVRPLSLPKKYLDTSDTTNGDEEIENMESLVQVVDPTRHPTDYPLRLMTNAYLVQFGMVLIYSSLAIFLLNTFMHFNSNRSMNNMFKFGQKDQRSQIIVQKQNVSINSFIGSPEIFDECTEVISFMKDFKTYKENGIEIPRGILLEGPPGCGKTLLAKVIASECDTSFISSSGSEFVEIYVGNGAARVRKLFETARNSKPCVLFIDEIDAVGKARMNTLMSNQEQEQTLNQILFEMDGFNDNDDILVIAATNRRDVLDKALLRPGRFDRIIYVPTPDKASRNKILKNYLDKKKTSQEVFDDLGLFTEMTNGMSGAELKNVVNEAAIEAIKRNETVTNSITLKDMYVALDKIMLGVAKKTDDRTDDVRRLVAIHELGHAVVVNAFQRTFQFIKVTIQATYKGVGGSTIFHMKNEMLSKKDLRNQIVALLGGRAAEEMYYGKENCSIGASRDLEEANELAYKMVNMFGFGSNLATGDRFSDITKSKVEEDILLILEECYQEAMEILKTHRNMIDGLIDELLEKETIYNKEFPNVKIMF